MERGEFDLYVLNGRRRRALPSKAVEVKEEVERVVGEVRGGF